jgi:hypothetical protein
LWIPDDSTIPAIRTRTNARRGRCRSFATRAAAAAIRTVSAANDVAPRVEIDACFGSHGVSGGVVPWSGLPGWAWFGQQVAIAARFASCCWTFHRCTSGSGVRPGS